MFFVPEAIEAYASMYSSEEPELLAELAVVTRAEMEYPQMLTGKIEGRLLKLLAQLGGAEFALEIGTFTGYSALSIAEGLPDSGKLITCEINPLAAAIAQRFFSWSPFGKKIELRLAPALQTIAELNDKPLDFVFIDADKENYLQYYERVMPKVRSGGLIVVDNALWSGKVLSPNDRETECIHQLNRRVASDLRVECVLLTVRDGVQVIRKR